MVRNILFALLLVVVLVGCNDDDEKYETIIDGETEITYIPDDVFEEGLIRLGYDNNKDNWVPTKNIKNVEILDFEVTEQGPYIKDLTGIEDFTALKKLL